MFTCECGIQTRRKIRGIPTCDDCMVIIWWTGRRPIIVSEDKMKELLNG